MQRLIACAVFLALFVPAPSRAQDIEWHAPEAPSDDDLAAARDAYARGLEAMERGDAAEALAEFRLSYARSGVLASLFNAALALSRLGRYVEAGAALAVLEERSPPDEVIASAAELRSEVHARIARLVLVDVPAEASVSIDDRPVAVPEGASEVERAVDPGTHRVSVRSGALVPFTWSGPLLAGERREVRVELVPRETSGGGDDAGIIVGVVLGAAAVVAGVIIAAVLLDQDAQLEPTAPNVFRFP